MPLIFHWHTNYDNLLKVQNFKDNRSSNLAFARTPSSSARSQRGAEGLEGKSLAALGKLFDVSPSTVRDCLPRQAVVLWSIRGWGSAKMVG